MEPRCSGGMEMETCEIKALISREKHHKTIAKGSVYQPQLQGGGGGQRKKAPYPWGRDRNQKHL